MHKSSHREIEKYEKPTQFGTPPKSQNAAIIEITEKQEKYVSTLHLIMSNNFKRFK